MKWMIPSTLVLCLLNPSMGGAQPSIALADLDPLVSRLQTIADAVDPEGFLALLTPGADLDAARDFARDGFRVDVDRTVVIPRFLISAEEEGESHELTVEVFTETGDRARLQTWSLEVIRAATALASASTDAAAPATGSADAWTITGYEAMDGIDSLYHLTLNPDLQYDAENIVIAAEDMTLQMSSGAVFVAEVGAGITGLALVGDGVMTFAPSPEAERRQVEIFSDSEVLEAEFTHAFVRFNPTMFSSRVAPAQLTERPVDPRALQEAQEHFDTYGPLSYTIDLGSVSDRTWWLTPTAGHFQAEVTTRRHGNLTYTQAQHQPEDVSLFQREPTYTIISIYSSARQRATQGKYYDDQDSVSYDILDYDVVASFEPAGVTQESLQAQPELEGCWIEGTTRLAVEVTGLNLRNLGLALAGDLKVHSVTSREFGPLLFFRMGGPDSLVISLPDAAPIGTQFTVVVNYSGLLRAQSADENWLGRSRVLRRVRGPIFGVGERRYIYSGATAWYPRGVVPDFATATMELTVPADYGVIASGDAADDNPPLSQADNPGPKSYRFTALQPAKYLSAILSRFWPHETPVREVPLVPATPMPPVRSGVVYDGVQLSVETNPRSAELLGDYQARAEDILGFYGSIMGDLPYPTLTLALTDSYLPGGHSPAYFSVVNQPLPLAPGTMWSFGDDPVAFSETEHFFLAHELAHQWWGQAVGWKNYHEQWLSEALAQYFAALYIQKDSGESEFQNVLEQMRDWSTRHSDDGPVYLGYRLGHIEGDARAYRALVYNKGAMVLHMLRRLIGDEAFFSGLRRYYGEMRFQKAGTDDLIRAFETEAVRSLESFFDRWIHESALPELQFDYRTEARASGAQNEIDLVVAFEQTGPIFEVPVTVTLRYQSGEVETAVIPVTEQLTEVRIPLRGELRDVAVNEDDVTLGNIRQ
jgi:hypothetical protein